MASLHIPSEVEFHGRIIKASVGERISTVRAPGNVEVMVVASGLMQAARQDQDGGGVTRITGPGDVVGAEALEGEVVHHVIHCLTDGRLIGFNIRKIDGNLAVCRWLADRLAVQLQQTEREIQWMRSLSVENRVQLHLNDLSAKVDGDEIPISQADLAQVVGATRETISTVLNRLARAGLIRLSRRSIRVVQRESLAIGKAQGL